MKNIIILCIVFLFIGCVKEDKGCKPTSPQSEEARILAFATANNFSVIRHSGGVYYQVVDIGTGARPTLTSEITVAYVGKFLDGTIFDQHNNVKNYLNKFIEGWQIGLPVISKGGTIRLIIPSAYAYRCTQYQNIPANSILFFEINLIDVQ